MKKWRVYTVTDDDEAGSDVIEAKNMKRAASKALEHPRFEDVLDVEQFDRGNINHPFHS